MELDVLADDSAQHFSTLDTTALSWSVFGSTICCRLNASS